MERGIGKIKRAVMKVSMHAYPGKLCDDCEVETDAVVAYITQGKPKLIYFKCKEHSLTHTAGN
jgi:hypothetical protein